MFVVLGIAEGLENQGALFFTLDKMPHFVLFRLPFIEPRPYPWMPPITLEWYDKRKPLNYLLCGIRHSSLKDGSTIAQVAAVCNRCCRARQWAVAGGDVCAGASAFGAYHRTQPGIARATLLD